MCQLLGMNSSKPAGLDFSFAGFAERGGRTAEHSDGWGIAFHGAESCHLIIDQRASSDSPLVQAFKESRLRARNVVAHIRKATQGAISLANSHPFTRELWGRTWSFAHNGNLVDFAPPSTGAYTPVGQTDSERAFCHLMGALATRFATQPGRSALFDAVATIAGAIARHGTFNFILSNGDILLAHCSTRLHYVIRQYPFAQARLLDCDLQIDFNRHNHLDDRMVVVATEPLTSGEQWLALAPGQLSMFADGVPQHAPTPAHQKRRLLLSY
ncbi:class II glutamine amidotransferase [Massilia sp. DWR3-1-1]|uniref:class II glutamine amidotransferase n=1 Tax=Massilia sp. DWR3-1-1 TaxID=2804559 RepID=UPI003CE90718